MIQSASTLPAPPADWMPIELKPAATYRPRISGVSPKRYRSSGVKLSGPLKNTCTPADSSAGTRCMALANSGSMCPRSAGKCSKAKLSGIPPSPQGFARGSNHPTRSLPVSSLKYERASASRRIGRPDASPAMGCVTM